MVGDCCIQRVSNEEMAARLNVSKRHLSKIVLRRYGMSLQQVFSQKRLEMSEELLKTTDFSIEQICEKIGWSSNKSTFFKAFKKKYGMPPGRYREK
jgi:transcriptional regulator GlxA family with amidase domain